MTDKLPIERLEEILDIYEAEAVESGVDGCPQFSLDICAMASELIAIRNANPVAYGLPNSAITGMPHALMQLAIEIPSNDQYGGALWLPLIIKP